MTFRLAVIAGLVLVVAVSTLVVLDSWSEEGDVVLDSDPTHVIPDAGADAVTFEMHALRDSGQEGAVTLDPRDDGTLVGVELTAPTEVEQPMHLYEGTCEDLGDPVHELDPLETRGDGVFGYSQTLVADDVVFGHGPLALGVQTAPWDPRLRACGELATG